MAQGLDVLEMARQQLCRRLAHHAYSECEDHTFERNLL